MPAIALPAQNWSGLSRDNSFRLTSEYFLVTAANPDANPRLPVPSTLTTVALARISRFESTVSTGRSTLIRITLPAGGQVLAKTNTPRSDMSRVVPSCDADPEEPGSLQVN